jgi:hypothetical protein
MPFQHCHGGSSSAETLPILEALNPHQDLIGNLYGTSILIGLALNFDHVETNSAMTHAP